MRSILLKNGLHMNMENGSMSKMDILIENGKIKNIAKNISCGSVDLDIIDLKEYYVYPGFIDCHTHMGIIEEGTGKIGKDNNEDSNPVTPEIRAIDGINPQDMAFNDAVRHGITCVMSGPGSHNAVGGQNVAIKTAGNIIDKMIVKNPLGLKISLGEEPICTYGVQGKCPVTRMATTALIRDLFLRTQDYMQIRENGKLKERNMQLEAVIPLLKGDMYLRAHAHRADDIISAIRIAEEFHIEKLVIEHGTEAHLIMDYLKERSIPVAYGPMFTPRIKMELINRNYSSAVKLVQGGIKVAFITDHPYNSIDQLRSVAIQATSEGLSPLESIKCITINPAEIMGCEDRIGKLKEGYDADIVVLDKTALDIMAKVKLTIIDGKIAYNSDISF
ncbi:amidohydrolase [Clostridium estertheticum]|uniref:amidohydrolase n=1 Tax=Clostridium estertheticum TaxID=238834 RepID=UPI001C0E3AEF|nr:amidohydrolase [Clostridium estertheticum]MBU3172858.1 amidohydrolase [Clostridium estertheticum]